MGSLAACLLQIQDDLLLDFLDAAQDRRFARFHQLAGSDDFVENLVAFVEAEHQIELAHVAEERVEHFDKQVNRFEITVCE